MKYRVTPVFDGFWIEVLKGMGIWKRMEFHADEGDAWERIEEIQENELDKRRRGV